MGAVVARGMPQGAHNYCTGLKHADLNALLSFITVCSTYY